MNIIQTWKSREFFTLYSFYENLMKHKNNWNYLFFDDNDIVKFIQTKMPTYYDFFQKFTIQDTTN